MQCGGSDGYSGITANPALGAAVDILVRHGGTAILSETPEIYGAEHLLTRRAASREVGEKLVDIIHWWEDYTKRNLMEMNNNPSPGNKLGGLTTILEKSLGAAAKGGTTTLTRSIAMPNRSRPKASFSWIRRAMIPSLRPVRWRVAPISCASPRGAARPMAASRRRRSSSPPIQMSTGSMIEDMDINCGDVLDGVSIADKGQEIFDKILKVASGETTKSEVLGYGDNEFVPWQVGAVM